jgi:hypothetical protein
MGTANEWVHVALVSIFWSGAMLLLESVRRDGEFKLARPGLATLTFALGGLLFGLLTTFGWRVLRVPLIFLTAGLLIAGCVCGRLFRGGRPGQ